MTEIDRFSKALDDLVADRSPRAEAAGLDEDEQRMLRMAQLLRGSVGKPPDPSFASDLRSQLLRPRKRLSRRNLVVSGIGALAAGVVGALGLRKATQHQETNTPSHGKWFVVGAVTELAPGSVRPFTAGAVQGVLINHRGQYRAMSRICTHMHCVLKFEQAAEALSCPCHGAEFDLNGKNLFGPGGYSGELPPLPALQVRVRGESVEVLGA